MTQNTKCKITTNEFFRLLNDEVDREKYIHIAKAIDKLRSNISNHSDENINLDYQDIETCFKKTTYGIIQLVETHNISIGLNKIMHNSILEINTKNLTQHIIIHFTIHPSIGLSEVATSIECIHDTVHEDADVCFCISYRDSSRIKQIEIDSFIFY